MSNLHGETHSLHCDCVDPNNVPDLRNVSREEFETVAKQVAEIHGFLTGIATALKSPMLAAMLPPNLRNMLP